MSFPELIRGNSGTGASVESTDWYRYQFRLMLMVAVPFWRVNRFTKSWFSGNITWRNCWQA